MSSKALALKGGFRSVSLACLSGKPTWIHSAATSVRACSSSAAGGVGGGGGRAAQGLTHVDESGAPTMVDVGEKQVSTRTAMARSHVRVPDAVMSLVCAGGAEMMSKKGPVFSTAIIAGTMAAKRTHDIIPFCHPLGLESCKIAIKAEGSNTIAIDCKVKVTGKTGVEMEALTGASAAALTIYDMCKAVSHDMVITTSLVSKTGGKSDVDKDRKAS
jgi:cyclic pyranopterin phosphate synthase